MFYNTLYKGGILNFGWPDDARKHDYRTMTRTDARTFCGIPGV